MKKKEKKAGKKPAKSQKENEMFNFDNEIVIGVTKIPETDAKTKNKQKNKIKTKNKKAKKGQASSVKHKPNKKIDLKKEKRKRRIINFMKSIAIITIILGAILGILLSPLFKLEEIEIIGNEKITSEEIINLSNITNGKNIFLINNHSVINQIKQNPYIENVTVKRKLPNKIVLEIEERKATYFLKYEDEYIYINNQGYVLEISNTSNNLTQIISYRTQIEDIKVGGRLGNEDLESLGTILKIMEVANTNGIGNLITSIDIANKNDIILNMESER